MKKIILSLLVALVLIGVATAMLVNGNDSGAADSQNANNVSVVDGTQIIAISAKGGYSPRTTNAAAGMPTVIQVATNGTFDCSAALSIPNLNYRAALSPTEVVDIEVPPQEAGTTVQGLCSMGMYNFEINFN